MDDHQWRIDETGEVVWRQRVGGNYSASPMLADGHVYFFSEEGRGTVLKAGRTFEEVSVNDVPGMGTTACPG